MNRFLKQYAEFLNFLLTGINTVLILVLIFFVYGKLDESVTGPIGDTFGGLFSPIIGIVSVLYIFKTFNEQRRQFKKEKRLLKAESTAREQESLRLRNKEHVDRLTDIIYRQLQRIDDNLQSHRFTIESENIEGRRGFYALNARLKMNLVFINSINKEHVQWVYAIQRLENNISTNMDSLVDYFDHILVSLAVISTNIDYAGFHTRRDEIELIRLFLLNLSASFEETVDRFKTILTLIDEEPGTVAESLEFNRLNILIDDIIDRTKQSVGKVINSPQQNTPATE